MKLAARLACAAVVAMALSAPALAQAPETPYPTTIFAEGTKSASVTAEGITAPVALERRLSVDPTMDVPVLTVRVGKRMVQEVLGTPPGFDFPAAEASIVEIDPGNATPEVYFSSFTGGAHCCNEIFVVEARGAEWISVSVGAFDGGGNFLRDADDDGLAEIVVVDNVFLYQFDAYAGSAGPLQILTVRDGSVADLSADPRFVEAHREWTAELESWLPEADRWAAPGFIAGWVASKIRSGEGAEAWAEFEANWDAVSDPGFEICLDGGDPYTCAAGRTAKVPFPEALRRFLNEHGYAV